MRMMNYEEKNITESLEHRLSATFVGRSKQMEQLSTLLERTVKGAGCFVLVSGEAGTGKSTLIRQFSTYAANSGVTFISENLGRVHSFEPYTPFLRMIAKLGGSKIDSLMERVGATEENAPTAARAGGGNRSPLWNLEALYSLQTRTGLAQQLLISALLEAAREKPLLIALTDAHLAPLTAWQFIHYLSRSIAEHPIMILLSLRQDGKVLNHDKIPVYSDVLQRMNREGLVEKIQLKRFTREETRKYYRNVFYRMDFDSHFIPAVLEVSGGLPRHLVSLTGALVHKKIIYEKNSIWFIRENFSHQMILKISREDNELAGIGSVVRKFDILQKTILNYMVLMQGYNFNHRILADLLNMTPVAIIKQFQFFTDAKILAARDDGKYYFRRPAIQSMIESQIPPETRVTLHSEIADVVSRADYLTNSQKISLLAHHFSHTANKKAAFIYLHRAGEMALKNFAIAEALLYYQKAVALLPSVRNLLERYEQATMLLEAAWLDRMLGNWSESLQFCQMAEEVCDQRTLENLGMHIRIQKGFTYFRENNWEDALRCFRESLDRSAADDQSFNFALLNYGLASVYFELADYVTAKKYYEIALAIASESEYEILLANILNNLGALESVQGNHLQAIGLYSRSVPIFTKMDDRAGLARIYHNIGMTHAEAKNWKHANEFYGKSLHLSDDLGLMPLKSITFLNRALALAYLENFVEAREYNFKALRILEHLHDELGLAEYHKIQGVIERQEGNCERAASFFQLALDEFRKLKNKLGFAETECEMARLFRLNMDGAHANDWTLRAIRSFDGLGLKRQMEAIRDEFGLNDSSIGYEEKAIVEKG